jgi:hypothetical protein
LLGVDDRGWLASFSDRAEGCVSLSLFKQLIFQFGIDDRAEKVFEMDGN